MDGSAPGYAELLARHARDAHDRNPNRYRDNLDLLRFSLRSLERHAPWCGQVVLVTMRPQLPPWLDRTAPGLRVVHHDEIFDPTHLPSFNSFAIVSNLHRIPGLSRRFLYLEDDFLLQRPLTPLDLETERGELIVHRKLFGTESGSRHGRAGLSPWESAIARTHQLLDARYGPRRRPTLRHTPRLFDVAVFAELEKLFGAELERTRASRFRAPDDVAPEVLYPCYLAEEGRAVWAPRLASLRDVGYLGLGNRAWWVRLGLARLRRLAPKFSNLNDNFGEQPNPRVERLVRAELSRWLPEPSRFEVC